MDMKKSLLATTALGTLLAATGMAHAEGMGLKVFGGINFAGNESIGPFIGTYAGVTKGSDPFTYGFAGTADIDPDMGYVFGGAVGYGWDNGFSVDLEVAYRRNQIDVSGAVAAGVAYITKGGGPGFYTFGTGTFAGTDGHLSAVSLMANAWYEFDTGTSIRPYVGGGVGIAWLDIHDIVEGKFVTTGGTYTSSIGVHGDDSGFAWQLGAGLAWEVAPGKDMVVEYRYFNGPKIENVRVHDLNNKLDIDYDSHAVLVGFKMGI